MTIATAFAPAAPTTGSVRTTSGPDSAPKLRQPMGRRPTRPPTRQVRVEAPAATRSPSPSDGPISTTSVARPIAEAEAALRRLSPGQVDRLRDLFQRIARGEMRSSALTWIGFSLTARQAGARMDLSFFCRDASGSVVGHRIEEAPHGAGSGFDFAGRTWRPAT